MVIIRRVVLTLFTVIAVLIVTIGALYAWVSTRTNGSLVSSGETRHYLLHVPASYDPAKPAPLVISLHGAYLYPRFQMRLTEWNALADAEGFLVVYPKAAGLPPLWRMEPGEGLAREVRFFENLITFLSNEYSIDEDRIYVNGYSNGAAMSFMLSCELGERIAAFGMVATPVLPWNWCARPVPVPVMALHGVNDPFVPYAGGENFLATDPLPGIEEWIESWAQRNACEEVPIDERMGQDVLLRRYASCRAGSTVALYSVNEAGHVWPGGMRFPGNAAGPNSDALETSAEMWRFFAAHARTN
jgi:polyhydroxybutyrate depolymerase